MALKAKFKPDMVRQRLENVLRVIEKRQIERLQYLGELCVKQARENGSYTDQTGNLRSSIGYAIFQDGKAVVENYQRVLSGANGMQEGVITSYSIHYTKLYDFCQ